MIWTRSSKAKEHVCDVTSLEADMCGHEHLQLCTLGSCTQCITALQDLTEENAQLVLGEKASHLASAAQALPFVPYHPDELRQRGHRTHVSRQRRRALANLDHVRRPHLAWWQIHHARDCEQSLRIAFYA